MVSTECLIVLIVLSCSQKSEGIFGGFFGLFGNRRGPKPEFLLYTKDIPSVKKLDPNDLSTITDSGLDISAKTLFLIHGYNDHGESSLIQNMKDELLKLPEAVNVIIVNWKKGASAGYFTAVKNVQWTGDSTVKLIGILINEGVPLSKFHLIGHSLGAQIAGRVGNIIDNIGRITGLDPAGYQFARKGKSKRLDASDADFVDIIHSDDGALYEMAFGYVPGMTAGAVDFYPNGGRKQPNCPTSKFSFRKDILMGQLSELTTKIACSHLRSITYFTNSINTCDYPVHLCPIGAAVPDARMGYHASPTLRGKFCLETSGTEPFCENSEQSALERFLRLLDSE